MNNFLKSSSLRSQFYQDEIFFIIFTHYKIEIGVTSGFSWSGNPVVHKSPPTVVTCYALTRRIEVLEWAGNLVIKRATWVSLAPAALAAPLRRRQTSLKCWSGCQKSLPGIYKRELEESLLSATSNRREMIEGASEWVIFISVQRDIFWGEIPIFFKR